MGLPLNFTTLVGIHTILSLVALLTGVIVLVGLLLGRRLNVWTEIFLASAIATSATGFGLPAASFGPSHWVGVVSLIVLALAVLALYVFHLAGAWSWTYVVAAVLALYFLVFVAIAQVFMKVPRLSAMAPTLSEPPFALTQLGALVLFAALAVACALAFRQEAAP